jgi:hypothetical protein
MGAAVWERCFVLRKLVISLLLSVTAVSGIAGFVPSVASAGSDSILWVENMDYWGRFGPQHTLNEVLSWSDNPPVCVNAIDRPQNTWVGASVCSQAYADHAYCTCKLREGWGGGGLGPTPVMMSTIQYWGQGL